MSNAKYKRYLKQSIPFGIIWLVFAVVYTFLEFGILGDLEYYPSTGNLYDFKSSFIHSCIAGFLSGFIQGWIELVWLRKLFINRALWVKVVVKSIFYVSFILIVLIIFSLLANSRLLKLGLFDPLVIRSLYVFMQEFSFWSVVIYLGLISFVALLFSEIREYVGMGVLYNFLLGKYHKPKQEIRIFMFLDMKASTTIAESIGHKQYFKLIKKYYADMTDAILETEGEIYQYVGDEIVVSWPERKGIQHNNCIRCFKKIKDAFEKNKQEYILEFGIAPDFKAGYHIGEVTIGEIGNIKKDIIYTGDILNTTARIQATCNTYKTKVLISEKLLLKLSKEKDFTHTKIGELELRGKKELVQLHSISF